jgi:hypothetical protein
MIGIIQSLDPSLITVAASNNELHLKNCHNTENQNMMKNEHSKVLQPGTQTQPLQQLQEEVGP